MKNYVLDGDQVKRLLYDDCYKNDSNNLVDISTQEVFDLYDEDTLLYQRDKTVNNLYKVWGELKEEEVSLSQMGIIYVFHNDNIVLPSGKHLTLRVATDLLDELATGRFPHYKFNIEQYDADTIWDEVHTPTDARGRLFWYTVINKLQNTDITHDSHMYRLFNNAKGISRYGELLVVTLTFGESSVTDFDFRNAFSGSDIQNISLKYKNGITRKRITRFREAFQDMNCIQILTANDIIVNDITSAFKNTKFNNINIGLENVDNGLTKPTIKASFAFQNCLRWKTRTAIVESGFPIPQNRINYTVDDTNYFGWRGEGTIRIHWDDIKMFDNAQILKIGISSNFANNTNIIDMQFVDPTRDTDNPDGSKFFGQYMQVVKIANLNKGNWKIDAPLDNDSVNYLLNNIFDLTKNINNRHLIPTDFNLFKNWKFYQCANNGTTSFPLYYRVGNNAGSVTIPAFTAEELNEVSLDPYAVWDCEENDLEGYTGEMKIAFSYDYPNGPGANNQNLDFELTAFGDNYLELYVEKIQNVAPNQIITFDFTQRNRNTSTINNYIQDDEIQTFHLAIKASNNQQIDNVDIRIKGAAGHEYSTVESATLKFTAVNDDNAFNAAKAVAQARGWTIQFAS